MLVKVKPDVFLNTEYITSVLLNKDEDTAHVFLVDVPTSWDISLEAAAHLLNIMEADDSAILPGDKGHNEQQVNSPGERPLTSRIAQELRDGFLNGAGVSGLEAITGASYGRCKAALDILIAENVVIVDKEADPPLYYHASHAPHATPIEKEIDLQNANALVDGIIKGEFQCVECAHQGCAACAFQNACCQCNCPSFTPRNLDAFTSAEVIAIHEAEKQARIDHQVKHNQAYVISHLEGLLTHLKRLSTTPNPDPLAEVEALGSRPGEDNENLTGRSNSD